MNKKTGSGRAIEKSHRTRALPHEAAVAKLRSIYTLPIFKLIGLPEKLIGLPEKLCPGEDVVTWAGLVSGVKASCYLISVILSSENSYQVVFG